jgi:hypothetical protein
VLRQAVIPEAAVDVGAFVRSGSSSGFRGGASGFRLHGGICGPDKSRTCQDRAKVAGGQKHEVAYEARKTGSSPSDVNQAVKTAGNSRKNVEAELGGKK